MVMRGGFFCISYAAGGCSMGSSIRYIAVLLCVLSSRVVLGIRMLEDDGLLHGSAAKVGDIDGASCCGKLNSLNTWNDTHRCDNYVAQFKTNHVQLRLSFLGDKSWGDRRAADASLESDLNQAMHWPVKQSQAKIQKAINDHVTDCKTGDEELPQSEQMKTDFEFLKAHAFEFDKHLMHTDFGYEVRAFDLILGNALITFSPLHAVLERFMLSLIVELQAVVPHIHLSEYAKVFPGDCYAGFTPDFKQDMTLTELKKWIKTANMRELMSKFYKWSGDFWSSKSWYKTREKNRCSLHETENRVLDPTAVFPRYRMPLKSVGMGWLELQQKSSPGRARMRYPALKTLQHHNISVLFTRADTLDPPMSRDEQAKLVECHDFIKVPEDRIPWNSGKFGYMVEENSPLWLLSQITGLPTSSGVSGSTYAIMSTAETLNLVEEELALLRLVLLGWQLPFQDHTLLEVMMGAARSFHGRSYPKWHSHGTPSLQDWKDIHQHLLPDNFDHDGVTLAALNKHISSYISSFNAQHGTAVAWPGMGGGNRWWEHKVFDFMMDEVAQMALTSPSPLKPCN